jgi:uncharacterized RDD family membrane protein YckC
VRVYAATVREMAPASETIGGSLKEEAESPRPRFVVERNEEDEELGADDRSVRSAFHSGIEPERESSTRMPGTSEPVSGSANQIQPDLLAAPNDSWREEVSARLHHYRARRRPRAPRYPSLRLKFETPENDWTPSTRASEAPALMARPAVLPEELTKKIPVADRVPDPPAPEQVRQTPIPTLASESTAKIIEFPKWSYTPPVRYSDLAEPMIDRPRIVEAPEIVPPPPALGGITIEEEHKQEPERRPGIDMPLQCAPAEQRLLAVAIDGMIVLLAGGIFAAVYYQIAGARPAIPQMIGLGAGLLTSFWVSYQYLLIVYSGTTPGLRAMKLQLQRFDGSVTTRTLRRWRVLGSVLSAISLGMGYAWQFLDEDALCWHERVTKTYLAPQSKEK